MLKLYDNQDSANGYKIRLLFSLIDMPYELIEVDIFKGGSRTPEYLAMNPNGRIPLLALEDGTYLPESGAILHYVAEGSDFLPLGRADHAQVLHWIFFEQYYHEPTVAVSRFIVHHTPADSPRRGEELTTKRKGGHAALAIMEQQLNTHDWFVADRPSIADIALFAYTHVAPEGGIELDGYDHIKGWIERIRQLPGFVSIR